MTTTLKALEAAIFTRLQTTKGAATLTDSLPFRTVERWAGEITGEEIDKAHLGRCPSALLAYEGSQVVRAGELRDFVETLAHDVMIVERHNFRVYVTVADARNEAGILLGGTNAPGLYACTEAVARALAGYRVSGLYDGGCLALVERRPWRIQRGESRTDLVRFSALVELPAAAETLPGVELSRVDGHFNDESADTDGEAVPISKSRTTL